MSPIPTFTPPQIWMWREQRRKERAANAAPGIRLPSEQAVALDGPLQPQSVAAIVGAP